VAATLITAGWYVAGYQKSLLSSLAPLTSAAGAVVFGRLGLLVTVTLLPGGHQPRRAHRDPSRPRGHDISGEEPGRHAAETPGQAVNLY